MKIKNSIFFVFTSFYLFANEPESLSTLDAYLYQKGFSLSPVHSAKNEGYSSEAQRKTFQDDCRLIPGLKKILEIGFNGGHSCEAFLNSSPDVSVTSFDINSHPYTQVGVDFMFKKYPERFQFVPGDSSVTIRAYTKAHPDEKFDLIFIDGCHEYNAAITDIVNCQQLAHRNTVVWIDDYAPWGIKKVVDDCVAQGLLQLDQAKSVEDSSGVRNWAIAKYQYLTDCEKIFGHIYQHGLWGRDATGKGTSGPGSSLSQGKPFIEYVQNFLNTHEIRSIADVGCGDWVLAQNIDWGGRKYTGIDVVSSVIEKNQASYGTDTIRFIQLDAGTASLPTADLLICKDVLMHLPIAMIQHVLTESKKFKYCIFVHDISISGTVNRDIQIGDFRPLDLTRAPFHLFPIETHNYFSGTALKHMILIQN